MSLAYSKVINEVLNLLGAVAGATAASADANYTASPSTSTVDGPDFLPNQVVDAIFAAQGEIAEAIASTPLHPERTRYADVTSSLANRASIPRTGSGTSKLIIGIPGVVKDASTSKPLLPMALDAVRSFNEFSSTVYNGFSAHWYAINSGQVEHTRTNVIIEVCVYERPTSSSGNIDIDDHHEGGLVQGAVAKLALKEAMFAELYQGANTMWQAHIAQIRNYSNPSLYGKSQAAPSST